MSDMTVRIRNIKGIFLDNEFMNRVVNVDEPYFLAKVGNN